MSSVPVPWNGVIDWAYVITLESTPHRHPQIQSRLQDAQLADLSTVLHMKKHPINGSYGCYESHVKTLDEARRERRMFPLVLEDDFEFTPDYTTYLPAVASFIQSAPSDSWEFLMLGMFPIGKSTPTQYPHIYKTECAVQAHAYIANMNSPRLQNGIEPSVFNPDAGQAIDNRLFCDYVPYWAVYTYDTSKRTFAQERADGSSPLKYRTFFLNPMIAVQAFDGTSSASQHPSVTMRVASNPKFMRTMQNVSRHVSVPTCAWLLGGVGLLLLTLVLAISLACGLKRKTLRT